MRRKTCCVTGHRPDAFPWNNHTEDIRFHILRNRIAQAVDTALLLNARRFICGNALGVDTWTAQIILEKKYRNSDIYLEIALPFLSHNSNSFSCLNIQKQADWTHVVTTEKCRKAAFFQRDKYMVDNSDMIIAVYDNQIIRKGGTQRTLAMAKEKGIEIIQISWGDI